MDYNHNINLQSENAMKSITRIEEMIMLAILNLGDDAYLVSIQAYLSEILKKKVSLTSVHLPLRRLEKINYLGTKMGEATAVRGGRRKKIYKVTDIGYLALEEYRNISNRLWDTYLEMETR
jgi:PadR family transcriptional regulator PadR